MIGNYAVTQTTYAEFCDTLRRLASGVTDERLYHEWCRAGEREGPIDYDRIAMRIATTHPKRLLRDAVMTTDQLRADAENVELGIRRRGASNFTDCAYRLARFAALMTDETLVDESFAKQLPLEYAFNTAGNGWEAKHFRINDHHDLVFHSVDGVSIFGRKWEIRNPTRGQLRLLLLGLGCEVRG